MPDNKKKSKIIQMQPQVNESFIKSKARSLPIKACYISDIWMEARMANIIVARDLGAGKMLMGNYLVDLLCLGIRDIYIENNLSEAEFEDLLERVRNLGENHVPCDYSLAHHIIYGSLNFAAKFGFDPVEEFELAKYILEAEHADLPTHNIDFGEEGTPVLLVDSENKMEQEIAQLKKKVGSGNFRIEYLLNEEDWDEKGMKMHDKGDMDFLDDELFQDMLDFGDEEEELDLSGEEIDQLKKEDWEELLAGAIDFTVQSLFRVTRYGFEKRCGKDTKQEQFELIKLLPKMLTDKDKADHFTPGPEAADYDPFIVSNRLIEEENDDVIKELEQVVKKYPDNPLHYHQLAMAYKLNDEEDACRKLIKEMPSKFPDFIYTYLDRIELLIEDGELDKVREIIGEKDDIKNLLPERKLFHYNDLIAYHGQMVNYYIQCNNYPMAILHLETGMNYYNEGNVWTPIVDFLCSSMLEKIIASFGLTKR